ncbi:MAG TPA: hypothetical protein VFV50_19820, partial [Bdellovibrionales bacterium]|nr:hypothetical protein [Bdellovibrionales bacterium]
MILRPLLLLGLLVAFAVQPASARTVKNKTKRYTISWEEFRQLKTADQAEYLAQLRSVVVELERAGAFKSASRSRGSAIPAWLLEQAIAANAMRAPLLAQAGADGTTAATAAARAAENAEQGRTDMFCFVGGNVIDKGGRYCSITSEIRCRAPGGQPGIKCNWMLYSFKGDAPTDANIICVNEYDDPSGPKTPANRRNISNRCDAERVKIAGADRKTAEYIKNASNSDDLRNTFENLRTATNAGCSSVTQQRELGLCGKLAQRADRVFAQLGPRPEPGTEPPPATTEPPPPPPITDTPPPPPPGGQEPPPVEQVSSCLTTQQLERTTESFCQFKFKGVGGKYFMIRKKPGSDKLLIFSSARATGEWCPAPESDTTRNEDLKKPDVEYGCILPRYALVTKALTGKSQYFEIVREERKLNKCSLQN